MLQLPYKKGLMEEKSMKRKIILMVAYEAFKNKGVDLQPCVAIDDLFLGAFDYLEDIFGNTFEGLEKFYDFLRYECDIRTGKIDENCEVISESGHYKLVQCL